LGTAGTQGRRLSGRRGGDDGVREYAHLLLEGGAGFERGMIGFQRDSSTAMKSSSRSLKLP
jgi:hypothetical protein